MADRANGAAAEQTVCVGFIATRFRNKMVPPRTAAASRTRPHTTYTHRFRSLLAAA